MSCSTFLPLLHVPAHSGFNLPSLQRIPAYLYPSRFLRPLPSLSLGLLPLQLILATRLGFSAFFSKVLPTIHASTFRHFYNADFDGAPPVTTVLLFFGGPDRSLPPPGQTQRFNLTDDFSVRPPPVIFFPLLSTSAPSK